jgi:putative MATE family efflux protein
MAEGTPQLGAPDVPPTFLARLRERDHTQGSLLASLIVLALPSILMSALGFGLFQLVDLRFLSRLGDVEVAAAGATNQTLRQAFVLLMMGIGVSSQMRIARLVGEGRLDGAEHVAGQSFVLGAGIAVLAILTGGLFPEFFVSLVTRDPEVVALGTIYVRIAFLTLGVMIAVQIFNAVLNGAGDTATPMIVTFVIAPVSIFGEWVLAFGHLGFPALGIAGIALGAASGGLCGVGIAVWALFGGRCRVHLRARHLVPDWPMVRQLISTAWQPALHMLARTMIVFFFMALAGRLGGKVQAAYTIGLRIELLVIMIAFPIANACATLVGQNLGGGDVSRAWRAIRAAAGLELGCLWPAAALLFLLRHRIVLLFTGDPEVAAMAGEYLGYSSVVLLFYGLYFVAFRSLQAAGDMRTPMIISVGTALLIGAPAGFLLATRFGLGATGMWIANLVSTSINTLLTVGWLLVGRWARP